VELKKEVDALFHFDTDTGDIDQNVQRKLEGRKLTSFDLRCTLLAPLDLFPPTIVVPPVGAYANECIQGEPGVVTLMILEVVQHSPDLRYGADGRGLFSWDYRVRLASKRPARETIHL
jgi:hypothetical protein